MPFSTFIRSIFRCTYSTVSLDIQGSMKSIGMRHLVYLKHSFSAIFRVVDDTMLCIRVVYCKALIRVITLVRIAQYFGDATARKCFNALNIVKTLETVNFRFAAIRNEWRGECLKQTGNFKANDERGDEADRRTSISGRLVCVARPSPLYSVRAFRILFHPAVVRPESAWNSRRS